MTPLSILISFLCYTVLIFIVSYITGRKSDNRNFFIGNKTSPWPVVAYGMIGASLSGVTFISVPGWVGSTGFSYMMVVFGYLVGYAVIAGILLPLYYRLNLTSIYTYLESRFGFRSYKIGAFFFLLSRIIGASLRMYLVVNVLQIFVFDKWNIPFVFTVIIFIVLILLYTFRGGIKTIVWTDTLQTTFMLLSVIITLVLILTKLDVGFFQMTSEVVKSEYSKILITDWHDSRFFLKQFFSGAFIAIVMTGLDQDMMQKNLSCKNLGDAQKNMITLSLSLVPVNLLFLFLGAVLYIFAAKAGIHLPEKSDDLFPLIALNYLGPLAGVVFIIGLVSAAYSSADSALTSLTTSFSVDFLGFERKKDMDEGRKVRLRHGVHTGFAIILLFVIMIFRQINDSAVIQEIFTVAGYTYGPLLGLYSFGLFTKRRVRDRYVPLIAILSPLICFVLSSFSEQLFNGYKFGFELLILNGLLTFAGLYLISRVDQQIDDAV